MDAAPAFEQKIHSPRELEKILPRLSRPLVFTNGCFDLIHRGHVTYLAQARSLGASLLVALNDDASVRSLGKDPLRPINELSDRMAVIAALESVSAVTWFAQPTPLSLIELARPEVLVKGGDWPVEQMVGAREVLGWGGKAFSLPFIHQRSTTALLQKLRS